MKPTKTEIVMMLRNCAHNLYLASLCAGPESITRLAAELRNPKVGDLVMETSTFYMTDKRPALDGIGILVSDMREPKYTERQWKDAGAEEGEPIPDERVYVIKLIFDDGREYHWRNASFIKAKTDLSKL